MPKTFKVTQKMCEREVRKAVKLAFRDFFEGCWDAIHNRMDYVLIGDFSRAELEKLVTREIKSMVPKMAKRLTIDLRDDVKAS